MTIESNNPNKPKSLFYSITPMGVDKTTFSDKPPNIDEPFDENKPHIKTYKYLIGTNDEIPEDKFEEVKIAIHKILNP